MQGAAGDDPLDERIQVKCDAETRDLWEEFSSLYTTREAALRDLLRIAAEYPQLPRRRREWDVDLSDRF